MDIRHAAPPSFCTAPTTNTHKCICTLQHACTHTRTHLCSYEHAAFLAGQLDECLGSVTAGAHRSTRARPPLALRKQGKG